MATSFHRLKNINTQTKNLINGYIKSCQNELFGELCQENPYYNIPQLINNYCMLFYEVFKWYKKRHGPGLELVSDTKVKVTDVHHWAICMFENEISNETCDTFSVTFQVISFGRMEDICFGYATGKSLEESIKVWTQPLGRESNRNTTTSWTFCGALYYCDFKESFTAVQKSGSMKYSADDLFKISFDFKTKKVRVFQNNQEKGCKDLLTTKLWIGFALYSKGNSIEMVDYRYD